jgi:hypothetical protein
VRSGNVRQLALLSLRQTYDQNLASDGSNPDSDPFSDLNLGGSFSPTTYLSAGLQTNYHIQDASFSSYALSLGLMDDRSDMLRARYTFIDNSIEQLEGNAELALHARFRAGLYLRYDTKQSEVIETRGLLRFINSCKCWSADLGYGETINPDRQQVLFTFTFGGLGGITQGIGLPQQQAAQQ